MRAQCKDSPGFSYFGLYKVPCREGLRSSAVYLGTSQGEDKLSFAV